MEKSVIFNRKVLPALAAVAVIAALIGLAFMPTVRHGNIELAAAARGVGDEYADALYACVEYAEKNGFTAELSGSVKTYVVGVPYTLNVRGERRVAGEEFSSVKESVSAAFKVGLKTECRNGEYCSARGKYDKASGGFVYSEPEKSERDAFKATYGDQSALLRYDIDGNILSAERIDENTYRYTLAVAAAERCKAEMCSLVNCKTPPEFTSIELTLVTDGERAIKISAVERFKLDKFGGIECIAEYCEKFE